MGSPVPRLGGRARGHRLGSPGRARPPSPPRSWADAAPGTGVGLRPRRGAGPASARPGPRGLAARGHRYRPRGGVCNSLESCTELRAAQPLGSGARRRRSAARRGRGEGEEAGGPPLKGRPASPSCVGARGPRSPPALARSRGGKPQQKRCRGGNLDSTIFAALPWLPPFASSFPSVKWEKVLGRVQDPASRLTHKGREAWRSAGRARSRSCGAGYA